MAHEAVILVRDKDKEFDKAFLELAVARYGSVVGTAFVYDGVLEAEAHDASANVDKIMELNASFKECAIVHFLGKFPEGFNKEDNQPFTVLADQDGNPMLVCFLEGDFSQFHQAGSARSDAYFTFVKELQPKLKKIAQEKDGDLDEVLKELDHPVTKKDILRYMGTRGTVTFVAENGAIMSIAFNKELTEHPWGWASREIKAEEFPEKEDAPTETEADKKKRETREKIAAAKARFSGTVPVVAQGASAQAAAEAKGKETGYAEALDKAKSNNKSPTANGGDTALPRIKMVKRDIPIPKQSNNKRKKWIRARNNGVLPDNWEELKFLTIEEPVALDNLRDAMSQADRDKAAEIAKDTTPHHLPSKEELPVIEPHKLKKISDWAASVVPVKTVDASSNVMPSIDMIKATESEVENFFKQCKAIRLEQTFSWPLFRFIQLGNMDLRSLALMAMTYRNIYGQTLLDEEDDEKKTAPPAEAQPEAPKKKRIAM